MFLFYLSENHGNVTGEIHSTEPKSMIDIMYVIHYDMIFAIKYLFDGIYGIHFSACVLFSHNCSVVAYGFIMVQ